MEILKSLFGSSSRKQQNMTEEAAKILGERGMVDPRIYNPNIQFQGVSTPTNEMNYATAYVQRNQPSTINLVDPRFQNLFSNPLNPNTLAHEVEHSLAYTGGSELNAKRNRGDVFLDNYISLAGKDVNT
jgi:hypothetical protein